MSSAASLAVVAAQVDAFNAHDVDAFVATYAPDAEITGLGPHPVVGREAIRAFYAPRLSEPSLRCEISATVLFGERWVVAHESVSREGIAQETIATFDVRDGLIARASLVKG